MSEKRLYIFTSGTSLLDNLETSQKPKISKSLKSLKEAFPIDLYTNPQEWGEGRDNPGTDAEKIVNYYAKNYNKDNPKTTTAEIASYALLKLNPEDTIVFLCSDTEEGLFCAIANAYLLTEDGVPDLVAQWERPFHPDVILNWNLNIKKRSTDLQNLIRRRQIGIYQIPNFNPSNKYHFEKEGVGNLTYNLYQLIRDAKARGYRPVINFTAGYKAFIPLMTLVACWYGHVEMFGLYEGAKEFISIPSIISKPDAKLEEAVNKFNSGKIEFKTSLTEFQKQIFTRNNNGEVVLNPVGKTIAAILEVKKQGNS